MPPKRAAVPTNAFGAGSKALDKLTGRTSAPEPEVTESPTPEAPPPASAAPQSSITAIPENGNTVKPRSSKTVLPSEAVESEADDSSTREKVTFYLRPDQVEKLDDLVLTYKRRTGQRTNRNALLRLLLDRVDIDLLLTEG
jgi:hypothetical protein